MATEVQMQTNMADEKPQESDAASLECVTEHLGFAPIHFIDDLMDSVNTHLYKSMSKLEELVTVELGKGIETEKGMASIETLFESSVDKRFDRFEVFALRNIFSVPADTAAKLAQDMDEQILEILETDEAQLDAEIDELRKKLLASKYAKTRIEEEEEKLTKMMTLFEGVDGQFASLEKIARDGAAYPLNDKIKRLASDLTDLQDVTDQVQLRTTHPIMRERIAESDQRTRLMQSEIAMHIRKRRCLDTVDVNANTSASSQSSSVLGRGLAAAAATASKLSAWDVTREYRDAMAIGSVKEIEAFMNVMFCPRHEKVKASA